MEHRGSLQIATAQFENRSADKSYNLSRIDALAASAAGDGADVILFHECSVTSSNLVEPAILREIELLGPQVISCDPGTSNGCVSQDDSDLDAE